MPETDNKDNAVAKSKKVYILVILVILLTFYITSYTFFYWHGSSVNPWLHTADCVAYLDISTEDAGNRNGSMLFVLYFFYWPINKIHHEFFGGLQHASSLPLYRVQK